MKNESQIFPKTYKESKSSFWVRMNALFRVSEDTKVTETLPLFGVLLVTVLETQ